MSLITGKLNNVSKKNKNEKDEKNYIIITVINYPNIL